MITAPGLDEHVFFKALDDLGTLTDQAADEELVNVEKGGQWAARYRMIRPQLLEGKIKLL
jgi:hypothetical protein